MTKSSARSDGQRCTSKSQKRSLSDEAKATVFGRFRATYCILVTLPLTTNQVYRPAVDEGPGEVVDRVLLVLDGLGDDLGVEVVVLQRVHNIITHKSNFGEYDLSTIGKF